MNLSLQSFSPELFRPKSFRPKSLAVIVAAAFLLTGCSKSDPQVVADYEQKQDEQQDGGNNGGGTTSYNVAGKVIDGYVSGATVWLDVNGNGTYDQDSEPSAVSETAGNYSLELSEEHYACIPYTTLYVDVPVGAVDEDLGEVTEAYQMSFPPKLEALTDDDIFNISPLTSVIWELIDQRLDTKPEYKDEVLSCETLKDNQQLRNEIKNEITDVLSQVVSFYNLSTEQIYNDFVAEGDTVAYQVAQSIVTGLKASYKYKIELHEEFPNSEIRVTVYQDAELDQEFGFDKAWYRDEIVFLENGYFSSTVKLDENSNLQLEDKLIELVTRVDSSWPNGVQGDILKVRNDIYRNADGTYRCSASEGVNFVSGDVTFELENIYSLPGGEDDSACEYENLGTPYEINYGYYNNISTNEYELADLYFRESNAVFNMLPEWQKLLDNMDTLSKSALIEHLQGFNFAFDSDVQADTSYWHKRRVEGNVSVDKYSDGSWKRTTTNDDGTTTEECSTDGQTWEACGA